MIYFIYLFSNKYFLLNLDLQFYKKYLNRQDKLKESIVQKFVCVSLLQFSMFQNSFLRGIFMLIILREKENSLHLSPKQNFTFGNIQMCPQASQSRNTRMSLQSGSTVFWFAALISITWLTRCSGNLQLFGSLQLLQNWRFPKSYLITSGIKEAKFSIIWKRNCHNLNRLVHS